MMLRVICIDQSLVTGPGYLVPGDSYRVGRSSRCAFVLNHLSVSRYHAELTAAAESVRVKDLKSRNGTFVDGLKVVEAEVQVGQTIHFGGAGFQVIADDPRDDPASVNSAVSTFMAASPPTGAHASLASLSEAQRRVLDLLLTGLAEKEVASRLEISPHTVHNHVKEIYRRMGVNSRPELLALFVSDSKKRKLRK